MEEYITLIIGVLTIITGFTVITITYTKNRTVDEKNKHCWDRMSSMYDSFMKKDKDMYQNIDTRIRQISKQMMSFLKSAQLLESSLFH